MQKITRLSSLIALSIVLGILESFIPLFSIPGIKLGLANIVIVTTLYIYGLKEAVLVSILRILFISVLRTGFGLNLYFSLGGSILSLFGMFIAKKINFSIIGVSIIGSTCHILGQITIAIILLNTNLTYYLPLMIVLSIITGTIIGYISQENIKFLKNK